MATFPKELKYTKDHEWLKALPNDEGLIGITDYAQSQLGDVVFVELPEVGKEVAQHKVLGVVESVKSVSDIFCPVTCKVLEVNKNVEAKPETVNKSPYGDGWMAKVKILKKDELATLMTAEDYEKLVK